MEETLQTLRQRAMLVAGADFLCSLPASNVGVRASVNAHLQRKAVPLSRAGGCQGDGVGLGHRGLF